MIKVERLTLQMEPAYSEFILQDERNLIYATLAYRDFLLRAVGGEAIYLIALDEQGDIVGALPAFCFDSPGFGKVINSLPWYGSHGGCIAAGEQGGAVRQLLLNEIRHYSEGVDVLSTTVITSPFEEANLSDYMGVLEPSAIDRRIGQMTKLPVQGDAVKGCLEAAVRQKTRNIIRKSLKQGFILQKRDDEAAWRFLYLTHVENMKAVGGKSKPWDHFLALKEVIPSASRCLLMVMVDGVEVAALLLLYFNKTVEYITPVIKHEYRSHQPLSFLIWNGMLDAIQKGYVWWNWGGTWTSQESLHHFKAGWGAVDMPYTYLVRSSSEGRAKLASHRAELDQLFPYFYTYPYAEFDS